MWNDKMKAVTFSFDDGVTQDIRLIKILNRYGLKATFNINSGRLGDCDRLLRNGRMVNHNRIEEKDIRSVYAGHEIAAHTLTHPGLCELSDDEIIREVEQDRVRLSKICGYEVVGMAYPGGGLNNDERVARIIKSSTGIKYARTTTSTYKFERQSGLYRFNPSVYYIDGALQRVVKDFLDADLDTPSLLYIWGHSYEMDAEYISWEDFERVCEMLSGRDDIFYGTNREVLLG